MKQNKVIPKKIRLHISGFPDKLTRNLIDQAKIQNFVISEKKTSDVELVLDPIDANQWHGNCIAVIAEPKVVLPSIYRRDVLSKFRATIAISPERAMQIGTNFWTSIQFLPTAKGSWSKERSPRTCSIFGNKFSASVLSNYGLRRRVLLLDEQLENKIDLYGVDWLDPLWLQTQRKIYAARQQLMNLREFSFRELLGELYFVPLSYKGVMDTDMTKLFVYETSLVIENQSDYVSEKIWNSLVAGTVPFYVGPEIHDEMLESCVIQVENSAEAVIEAIYQTPIKLIRNKRKNIEKLLQNYDYNKQLVKSAKNLISLVSTILKA